MEILSTLDELAEQTQRLNMPGTTRVRLIVEERGLTTATLYASNSDQQADNEDNPPTRQPNRHT